MGYYFECTYCNRTTPVSDQDVNPFLVGRNCEDCGEDGCEECMPHSLCEGCRDDRESVEEEELEDEEDDDDDGIE